MPYVTARDGVRLAFDLVESPAGMTLPPVLLLHGFAGSADANWVRTGVLDALLDAGRPVLLADARGHGRSGRPHDPAAYAGSVLVDDVTTLVDALGLDEVDVAGYSMGAFVAARLVPRPWVRCVVLAGVGDAALSALDAARREAVAAAMLTPTAVSDPLARLLRRYADSVGADREALAAAQRGADFSAPATVSRAGIPTLVLAGERDRAVGDPAALARAIPGARLRRVPGDHLSAPTRPAFAAALASFLATVDRRAA